ncbi:MAG: M1 family metallopeptidase [Armatimonadetes bacterium]|nr:M1 family metallopeptidase [Armatimonadota bacterium]MDE2205358.1 M1 family metallopeptidase [Armatimonadota bacterium]
MHRFTTTLLAAAACLTCCIAADAQAPHNYNLEDVNWNISFDVATRTIFGDVTNTLTPTQRGVSEIAVNEGKLLIKRVLVNGRPVHYTVDAVHEQLVAHLARPANPGDPIHLRIVYSGQPQAGAYFVMPDRSDRVTTTPMIYTQGEAEDTRYWLPTYDEPDDKATSECHITVPAGYFALSNGKLMDVRHSGSRLVYHWKIAQPHSTYLISFVAGNYVKGHEAWGNLAVDYYVPAGTAAMGEPTFGGTADMVRFYSKLTGIKYPYAKFAQSAVADFPFGGMENISAVTQTIDALHPASESAVRDTRGLVAHELAHQWFGDLETCRNWPNIWLNEGFATFLPHFYFRHADGEDEYQIQKLGDMEGALRAVQAAPRAMIKRTYSVPMDLFFDGYAYGGGSARMFALQAVLGEKVFWKGIHHFLVKFSYKPATTHGFFQAMSESSGVDLSWFEKQYFHTAALPAIKVSRDGAAVTITQAEPVFTLNLDVWELVNGTWSKQRVALHSTTAVVQLQNADDPFLVDPRVNCLASIDYAQKFAPDVIKQLYAAAPNAAGKLRLAQMARSDGDDQLLESLFAGENSRALRRALVSMLPASDTEQLLRLMKDPDPRIRLSATDSLASGESSDAVIASLTSAWQHAPSFAVRAAALRGLLRLTRNNSLARRAWAMETYDESFRTTVLAWWTRENPDLARQVALKVLSANYREPVRRAAIGTLGTVKDKPGEKVVFNALVARLSDVSLGEKLSAVGALYRYGDAAALPYLHRLDNYSMYQLRGAAQRTEQALEGK